MQKKNSVLCDNVGNDLLSFMIKNGNIDQDTVQEALKMLEQEKYVKMNPYKRWEGSDGKWYVWLPDEEKGRVKRKRNTEREIINVICDFWKEKSSEDYSFKHRYEVWVERQKNCGRAGHTIKKYMTDYRRFFEGYPIEKMDVRKITEEMIFSHLKNVAIEKSIRYKAIKEGFGYVIGMYKKCIKDKVIKEDENPCTSVDIEMLERHCFENEKDDKSLVFTNEEKKVFCDKLQNPKNYNANMVVNMALELAMYTGMRAGEISALTWDCIKYDEGILIVKKQESYDPINKEYIIKAPKNRKKREFPLTDDIEDILKRVKAFEIKNGYFGEYVFQDKNGRIHARTISRSGENKTMSSEFTNTKSTKALRRTLNSNMRNLGASVTTASTIIGNSPKVNDNYYLKDTISIKDKADLVKKAGAFS